MIRDDKDRRTMEQLESDAITILAQQPGLRCGGLGDKLFQDISPLNGSAPFARIAGKVVRRLERAGKARYDPSANSKYGGWFLTERARAEYEESRCQKKQRSVKNAKTG